MIASFPESARRLETVAPQELPKLEAIARSCDADFHTAGGQWGFQAQSRPPEKPLTEGQKQFREFWPYLWVLIQSTIIMKVVIYYFGVDSANDPSLFNAVGLGLGISISFGSMALFAWRHHRRSKSERKN